MLPNATPLSSLIFHISVANSCNAVNYNLHASGAQKDKSSNFNESGWQAALKTSYGRYRDVINLPKTNYPVSGNNLLSSLSRLRLLYQDP